MTSEKPAVPEGEPRELTERRGEFAAELQRINEQLPRDMVPASAVIVIGYGIQQGELAPISMWQEAINDARRVLAEMQDGQ